MGGDRRPPCWPPVLKTTPAAGYAHQARHKSAEQEKRSASPSPVSKISGVGGGSRNSRCNGSIHERERHEKGGAGDTWEAWPVAVWSPAQRKVGEGQRTTPAPGPPSGCASASCSHKLQLRHCRHSWPVAAAQPERGGLLPGELRPGKLGPAHDAAGEQPPGQQGAASPATLCHGLVSSSQAPPRTLRPPQWPRLLGGLDGCRGWQESHGGATVAHALLAPSLPKLLCGC